MTGSASQEQFSFDANVDKLLSLFTNHIYSNPEIFLRELLSNASDAMDKARWQDHSRDYSITIDLDEDNKSITITDSGIGMDKDDLKNHLGTIAKSGTEAFIEQLGSKGGHDLSLIGQFGVGFYSCFVVAKSVAVHTRKVGSDQGLLWVSTGSGQYTIEEKPRKQEGTSVTVFFKEEQAEFCSFYRIQSLVQKYSNHIQYDVKMFEAAKDEPSAEGSEADDQAADSTASKGEYVVVNDKSKALWTLPKSEITDEDYNEFYKSFSHDFQEPMKVVHNKVEGGNVNYTSLLYIPSKAPFDLWNRDAKHGVKLYVNRVFIMDKSEHFLPNYLRFVKGIIDSSDLPLNISREILQQNRITQAIKNGCTKRVLDVLEKMATKDPEAYQTFWGEFGMVLKEGPAEDFSNKDKIIKLLRFASTHHEGSQQTTSLADYVSRMKEGQEEIYYIIADSYTAGSHSPHIEGLLADGFEVLVLYDRIDEWLMSTMQEFEGKKLKSITQGELARDKKETEPSDDFEDILKQMQEALQDQVKQVRATDRLKSSPCCIVADENQMSGHLQRLLKEAGQAVTKELPILEINTDHKIIQHLKQIQDDDLFAHWSKVLLDQAIVSEGGSLEDPATFIKNMNQLLLDSLD